MTIRSKLVGRKCCPTSSAGLIVWESLLKRIRMSNWRHIGLINRYRGVDNLLNHENIELYQDIKQNIVPNFCLLNLGNLFKLIRNRNVFMSLFIKSLLISRFFESTVSERKPGIYGYLFWLISFSLKNMKERSRDASFTIKNIKECNSSE